MAGWRFVLLFIVCLACRALPAMSAPPNVLLLIADDMRPVLKAYGNQETKTPELDRLMSRSTVFMNAHCQVALCGPSRTSFLTGRRPHSLKIYTTHGVKYWRQGAGNFTSLPQYFKESGYQTISLGKVYHPAHLDKNDDYPYSWTRVPYHASTEKYRKAKVCRGKDGLLHSNVVCPVNVSTQPEGTLPDIQIASEALFTLDELARSPSSQPFLLAVGFHKPHIPLKYPQHYRDLYPLSSIRPAADSGRPASLPPVAWNPFMDMKSRKDMNALNISFPYGAVPKHFQLDLIQSYYAAVSYMDHLAGLVINKTLSTFPNNTIIVFMSDHGFSLGEHGEWSKYSNYDVATRVPLSVFVPQTLGPPTKPAVYDMVELVDLFPTLADLAGLDRLPKCTSGRRQQLTCADGKSLAPLMLEQPLVLPSDFCNVSITQYPRPSLTPQVNSDEPRNEDIRYLGCAIKTSRYRYVRWVSFNQTTASPNLPDVFAEELYDITTDPGQDHNVASLYPSTVLRLYQLLLHYLEQ